MKSKHIKKQLLLEIKEVANNISGYCQNPATDLIRKRKLPADVLLKGIIGLESKSLTNELVDMFHASFDMPTKSAFVQQRNKLKPEAFKAIFDGFNKRIRNKSSNELVILAVDGTDIQTPTDSQDVESYFPGSNGQKSYNLLHLNALYDLSNHLYTDVIIQKAHKKNEHVALQKMIDRSDIHKALIIADRGYESYNNMAHIQEKGWFFLIRIRDGNHGIKKALELPASATYDVDVSLKLTRKQTKETKELLKKRNQYRFIPSTTPFDYLPQKSKKHEQAKYYELGFRVVRFQITEDTYETILTNLDETNYPPDKIKQLYARRWGIETSFRDLKYTVGMLNFHSKKVMCVQQEIYAHLIMYNFSEMITSHVVIKKKQSKYTYKANFSVAAHMCRKYYRGMTSPPDLETIISRNLVPVRPDRHRVRYPSARIFRGFLYRVS